MAVLRRGPRLVRGASPWPQPFFTNSRGSSFCRVLVWTMGPWRGAVPQRVSRTWEACGQRVPCAPCLLLELNPRPQRPIGTAELGLGGGARAHPDWEVQAWLPQSPRACGTALGGLEGALGEWTGAPEDLSLHPALRELHAGLGPGLGSSGKKLQLNQPPASTPRDPRPGLGNPIFREGGERGTAGTLGPQGLC